MTKDVPRSVGEIAEALREISREEVLEQILGFQGKVGWVADLASDDLLVQAHRIRVLREEWWIACQHLEDENSESVPVYALVVPFRLDNLWSEIVGSPAERPGDVGDVLGESEIGELDVAIGREENVLRF